MPFPDDFPAWAQYLTWAIVAIGLGIGAVVARLGLLQGRKEPPANNSSVAQVAAVIVDPAPLNRLTAAGEALNMTGIEMIGATKATARANAAVARSVTEVCKSIDALAEQVDRLRDEVIRSARKRE